jgi:hypothetical protein
MRIKNIFGIGIILFSIPLAISANSITWKVSIISAMPSRSSVPIEFCQQFSPDVYIGSFGQLQQGSVKAQNGMLVKYRNVHFNQDHELFFTEVDAVISKQLDPAHTWYNRWFIHLQQLTPNGVADGVWSTRDCKGRLIAEPWQTPLS